MLDLDGDGTGSGLCDSDLIGDDGGDRLCLDIRDLDDDRCKVGGDRKSSDWE